MTQEAFIRKLTDYVLLNAYSVNSTGLYNGKAGLSLSLFGVARLLNDDYIEDQAYELLQEALLSSNKDISFENGLGGIGYVLHYLISNQYIEADFKELFDEKMNIIKEFLENAQKQNSREAFAGNPSLVHFLNAVKDYYPEEEMNHWINLFSTEASHLLEEKFDKAETITNQGSKIGTLRLFETYVELADCYDSFTPEWSLLEKYGRMYQANKFMSSFTIGYHLKNMAARYHHPCLQTVAINNMERAIHNLYPDTMSLSQRIDTLYLLYENEIGNSNLIEQMEKGMLNNENHPDEYERNIIRNIRSTGLMAGYQHGIARLLLYWVYKKSPAPIHHLFL